MSMLFEHVAFLFGFGHVGPGDRFVIEPLVSRVLYLSSGTNLT